VSKARNRGFRRLEADELARITFLGASGEVTGSSYLLETAKARVLVDCGMCQGGSHSRAHNQRPFPFDARGLDTVVLTHAHVDHSGLVPKLVHDGFRGPIHATQASGGLLGVLLRDSAHIHEHDVKAENRRLQRRGKRPLEPLYTIEDAERALDHLVLHPFGRELEVAPGLRANYRRAGHILGAGSVEAWVGDGGATRKLVFSGDLGRRREPLLLPPDPPREAELVLMESTYGDRDHRPLEDTVAEFAEAVVRAMADGGNVIVPVFAVGRAQEILHYLGTLERAGRIPKVPVFLDSPMAISATELYRKYGDCFRPDDGAGHPCEALEPAQLSFTRTPEESMRLNERRGVIILSSSGMAEGGRILHHLRHHLWKATTDVVFVGFQAHGTLGRALVEGARTVRIFGEPVAVNARVHTLGGFSAHAGQSELVDWVSPMVKSGARVALVHGEPEKREVLARVLRERTGVEAWRPLRGDRIVVPRPGEAVRFLAREPEAAGSTKSG